MLPLDVYCRRCGGWCKTIMADKGDHLLIEHTFVHDRIEDCFDQLKKDFHEHMSRYHREEGKYEKL